MSARSTIATPQVDPDMPDEIDFSDAVRGSVGQRMLVQWARYRRALREIAQTSDLERDALGAARQMRDRARQALEGDATGAAE